MQSDIILGSQRQTFLLNIIGVVLITVQNGLEFDCAGAVFF